ncbi:DNA cytosine methyltransferase [bacterium]|nr:DNA cytosine methyltransferase [bacterium]MBO7084342.1 DNA cytosine methyltransferase [bacterium]
MRLMGFSELYRIVVPNRYAYRQAGNSIVVNILQALLKQIQKVVDLNE